MHELRDRNLALRLGSAVTAIEIGANGRPTAKLADGRAVTSECCCSPPAASAPPTTLNLGAVGIDGRQSRPHQGRSEDVADLGAAHLCRRRRDRISEPRLDLDGAGPRRRLPRLRHAAAAAAGVLPLRHLFGAGDFHRRHERGGGAQPRDPLRVRHRALPRDLARPHHGAQQRHDEDDLLDQDRAGCSASTSSAKARPSSSISARRCSTSKARIDYFIENTFNYPTLAEAYKIAGPGCVEPDGDRVGQSN